jgi:hypothetical protein
MKKIAPFAFIEAIIRFASQPEKIKDYFKDKRLTSLEKDILKALCFLRDNKPLETLNILKDKNEVGYDEVLSYRHYLMGLASSNITHYNEAIEHLHKAIKLLPENRYEDLNFSYHHNLIIIYFNFACYDLIPEELEKIKKNLHLKPIQKISLKLLEFRWAHVSLDFSLAEDKYLILKKEMSLLSEAQKAIFLIESFKFFVKIDRPKEVLNILSEMLKYRKYVHTANYNFMKYLSSFVYHDKPIYLKNKNELQIFPVLHHQLHCIHSLEAGMIEEATFHWNHLKQLSPNQYHDDFIYKGEINIFSKALEKIVKPMNNSITPPSHLLKTDKVLWILNESKGAIHQDELYQSIWGKYPDSKDDFVKLTQLIYKTKKIHSIKIKARKGCYFIDKEKAKAI